MSGIRIPTLTLRQTGAKDDPASPTFSISRTCSFAVNFFYDTYLHHLFSSHLSSIDCLITAASDFFISISISIEYPGVFIALLIYFLYRLLSRVLFSIHSPSLEEDRYDKLRLFDQSSKPTFVSFMNIGSI